MKTTTTTLDRLALQRQYLANRERSRQLFDLVQPEAYYDRPIALRHPVVFYEGHLPAFSLNTLGKRGLGRPGIDERLERLFARGIDPEDAAAAAQTEREDWPSRSEVLRFAEACDRLILDALANAPLEQPGHPLLHEAQAVHAILEHEAMHQETMLYMWHQLEHQAKRAPHGAEAEVGGTAPVPERIQIPSGRATLGAERGEVAFGWDNEFSRLIVDVPAFEVDAHNVTNERFLDFVEAGGYRDARWWTAGGFDWVRREQVEHPRLWLRADGEWRWHGMFDDVALAPAWPVYVSYAEAEAYARWKGARLLTEAEYHRAAFGEPQECERPFPWGSDAPDHTRGLFDFASWNPVGVGRYPAGQSAWGVHDLMGNGWEWTSTVFAPFPGFTPMSAYPEYSADFFDGQHLVMKGASPATAASLLRRSFRNWFRPTYPFVYATFRCARSSAS